MTIVFNTPKEKIFNALSEVYSPELTGRGWFSINDSDYTVQLMKALTADILSHIVDIYLMAPSKKKDYCLRTLNQEIMLKIWHAFSGGSTAQHAADKVCAALGIEKMEDA